MQNTLFRYLGFAFASADVLIELDDAGNITFSAGASGRLIDMDETELKGRNWRDLVAPNDRPVLEALLAGLESGARRGPVALELAHSQDDRPTTVSFYACRLPQLAPAISCAISLSTLQGRTGAVAPGGDFGLHDAASFEALTNGFAELSRATGVDLDIAFVELSGLNEIGVRDPELGRALLRNVAGTLRADSYGGMSAARLGKSRFALVRERISPDRIVPHLEAAMERSGVAADAVGVKSNAVALDAGAISNEKMLRALRYAIDNFIASGSASQPAGSLADVFQRQVQDTMERAGAFNAIVDARKFKLFYQPIVSLAAGALHHYEVLARFSGETSPFGMIRMAEELDLVERFDLAMIEAIVTRLNEADGATLSLAANMSGRSLMSGGFHDALMRMLKDRKAPAGRLIFEVTESAALTDLNVADRYIQALRGAGYPVCLDDFGSGAASFPYLKMLTVDSVKIDGQYVRELTKSSREGEMIRHLVNLCRSLKVETTAEMIEDRAVADQLKALGVDYGQGFFFGKPEAVPVRMKTPAQDKSAGVSVLGLRLRRKGARETWG